MRFYRENKAKTFRELFQFRLVNEDIIYNHLLNIKSDARGVDDISIKMLLLCCPFVLPYLANIMNDCLLRSVFPVTGK